MARKPGIGRIKRKPRRIKSYVGPDVEKAMEAVGLAPEVGAVPAPSALDVIATQLTRLADAAEKLVAKANEPVTRTPRKPKEPELIQQAHEAHVERATEKPFTGKVPEKTAPPPPTLDELRAAAVAYAGKHGKDALVSLLQKFNPEGKLSTIPENNLSPCLAALKMGMVD